MKKKILSLMAIFVVGILIFTGCGFQALSGGPSESDLVSSNGMVVVQKGNYLYFVNGLVSTSNLTGSANKYGEVEYSALYRTELDNSGKLQYDEDGKLIADVLAPKVVGFENGAFYIFGNKIYYASPNTEKNSSGEIDYTQTDFYVSNLDGTNVKHLYKTGVASTSFKFAFYAVDDSVVLAVYDSADLFMIDCNTKKVTLVAEGVANVIMPSLTEQASQDGDNFVYYTRSSTDDDKVARGNILAMASLKDKSEKVCLTNATYVVKAFQSDTLIYTKKGQNDEYACYYKISFANDTLDKNTEKQISTQEFTNEPLLLNFENGNYRGMIVKNESGYLTYIKSTSGSIPEFEVLNSEVVLTPLAIYGDEIYAYNSDSELYKLNYKTKVLTQLTDSDNITLDFSSYAHVDFDGKYVYAFQKISGDSEDGYYLARIDTTIGELPEVETLGKVLDKHIKTETDEETE